MNIPFLDLKWQHAQIKDNLRIRWDKILENTAFVIGDEVRTFENNYGKYCGTRYCIGVSSGTGALILAMRALDLPKGSEVITLPTSFIASAEAIIHAGLVPRFAEVDINTGNFDYKKLQKAVNKKTKAIMAVHLYGRMCDMDRIKAFAKKNKLRIIEDAAQAQGATFKGKVAGSIGDVGCFSFYPGKNLGAYGQAGAVVTNDEKIANLVRRLRDHGSLGKYDHEVLGYNEKIDNLQAPVLDEKLKHLNKWNKMRQGIAQKYYKAFSKLKGISILSPNEKNTKSVHHIFALRVADREAFGQKLKELGVATNIHYPQGLHTFKMLQQSKCKAGDFPVAERIARETITIPLYPGMTSAQIQYVIKSVKRVCKESTAKI
jgi:dTDP-4-amino-4,6-dideoxygalactose transaminase